LSNALNGKKRRTSNERARKVIRIKRAIAVIGARGIRLPFD
jgi:hypothetical protein